MSIPYYRRFDDDDADPDAVAPAAEARPLLLRDERLLAVIERIGRSEASALIAGETGTGKELVARHLHHCSGRRGPFVAVNCGAFTDSLIDAELFGHEAHAYTGAQHARAGWFEAAHGGTLFLDEIGELPLHQQVKLLRVLQERQVSRIGSRRPVRFDVRLIAATHVDLRQAVDEERFRSDLFFRLSVAPIALPPLRERADDILPLARHFIDRYAPRLGRPATRLSADAQELLLDYGWPGNVRELENAIHIALISCRDGLIPASALRLQGAALLPEAAAPDGAAATDGWAERSDGARGAAGAAGAAVRPGSTAGAASAAPPDPLDADAADDADDDGLADPPGATPASSEVEASLSGAFADLLDSRTPSLFQAVEEALVRTAFARSGDNQVRTAQALGLTRNTLRTLLKRHGLLADGPREPHGRDEAAPCAH